MLLTARCGERCEKCRLAAAVGLSLALGWGSPVAAQQFGRWWWDGDLGVAQRGTENSSGGQEVTDFDQQEFTASFGLNGFLGHPALGQFRLGLDLVVTEIDGGRNLDTERTGYAAEISVFPRGSYPFTLFYRQQLYDYTRQDSEEARPLVGLADTSTQWGGRLRLRKGALKGTLFGVEHTSYGLLGTGAREQVDDREFVDWSGSSRRTQNHLRLEHRLRDYGSVDLEIEDLTLNFDQRGESSGNWSWQISGLGIQREVGIGGAPRRGTDDYRLRTRLYRTVRSRDQLEVNSNIELSRPEGRDPLESLGFVLAYRWRPRQRWEIAPFLRYARRASGREEILSPRAGLTLSWTGTRGVMDWLVAGGVNFGGLERRDATTSSNESRAGFSVSASLGHGETKGLRKELEVEAGRNELRLSRESLVTELPDLGLPGRILGDEDFYRARATLAHRWDSKWLRAWGEWSRRESSGSAGVADFSSDTLTSTLELGSRRLSVQANVGETSISQMSVGGSQQLKFQGVSTRWRPWRHLSINGAFRDDVREFISAPKIDGDRTELAVEWRVGEIRVLAGIFETNESLEDGFERSNRGFRWSITRRLAGWLPIVTGTQRRGVIR